MGQTLAAHTSRLTRSRTVRATLTLFGLGVLVLVLSPELRHSLGALAGGDRESVRSFILGFGAFAPVASILLNVLQAIVAPIPGFVVPFVNGLVFGTWWGMLITWVGGIAAAATCFGIARTFGRSLGERICRRSAIADDLNRRIERHAFGAVFLGRFLPGMPFDLLSYASGMTRISFRTFMAGTALGSAPHAYLYAFMGATLHVPLWFGVLLMPAAGIAVATIHALTRRLRRAPQPAQAVTPSPGSPTHRGVPIGDWMGAPGTTCPGAAAAAVWSTRPVTAASQRR